jgi:hypothetical protein
MSPIYELWDTGSANCIGTYENEPAALEAVRQTVKLYGREAAMTLALGVEDEHEAFAAIAEGEALISRAEAVARGETMVAARR